MLIYLVIFEIDVTKKDAVQTDCLSEKESLDLGLLEFEGVEFEESYYLEEKRNGGKNSYQAYKPLRDKVKELYKAEIANKLILLQISYVIKLLE